jgi:predicted neuraminidase
VLERETEKEFSYPQLTQGPGGMIHLTYTWKRERIGHIAFNLAWLDQYREPAGGLLPQ